MRILIILLLISFNAIGQIPETYEDDSYGDISILEYLGILLISFVIVRVFYYIIALLDSYGSKNEEKLNHEKINKIQKKKNEEKLKKLQDDIAKSRRP